MSRCHSKYRWVVKARQWAENYAASNKVDAGPVIAGYFAGYRAALKKHLHKNPPSSTPPCQYSLGKREGVEL